MDAANFELAHDTTEVKRVPFTDPSLPTFVKGKGNAGRSHTGSQSVREPAMPAAKKEREGRTDADGGSAR